MVTGTRPASHIACRVLLLTSRHIAAYHYAMKRFLLTFSEEQLAALKKLSKQTGAPVAELIRRAVDAYLKKGKKNVS